MTSLPTSGPPQTKYRGRVISLIEEELTHAHGRKTVHATVQHPGAVVILPQDSDGSLVLLRQYRHSLRRSILEFPAGTLNPEEEPLVCAQREIQEEIKSRAEEWIDLGTVLPAPGFCSERQHCFLARTLVPSALQEDDDELIEIEHVSISQFERWVADGTVEDGKSIAIFARARLRGIL